MSTKMDEILRHDMEAGGRNIAKEKEPLPPQIESPLIQEMRLLHLDMVEEAYWKRVAASRLAIECKSIAREMNQRIKERLAKRPA